MEHLCENLIGWWHKPVRKNDKGITMTMNTYIALLRGINVGGNNKLPMRALTSLLEEMEFRNVKTYIQSGNVVFQSERTDIAALEKEISAAIKKSHGFAPQIFI